MKVALKKVKILNVPSIVNMLKILKKKICNDDEIAFFPPVTGG